MTDSNKQIVEACAELMAELSYSSKMEVLGALSKLSRPDSKKKDSAFYASFGAFPDDKSAEEIIAEIKASRSFRESGWMLSRDNSLKETMHLVASTANRNRLLESIREVEIGRSNAR